MREIVHLQAGQCGNQIGAKVGCFTITFKGSFCRENQRRETECCVVTAVDFMENILLFVFSFGKLFQMNMESIQLVHITVIRTSS